MITLVDTYSGSSAYLFTETGDTLLLKGSPVLGASKVLEIIFDIGYGDLSKSIRYSVDSLNWSKWIDIQELNLSNIEIDPLHFFSFEIKLTLESQRSALLNSIEVLFDYSVPSEPDFYSEHPLSKFVSYYNYPSITWSLNVLEKVYRQGIVPKYIERSSNENWCDKDYIDFWFPIIYYLSLNLTFSNIFKDLVWYPSLLHEYLRQKGLFLGTDIRLEELVYLMEHYYSEILGRGSLSSLTDKVDSEGKTIIRSELSRLIDKNKFDEFSVVVVNSEENGWVVGRTCCGFYETDFYKGYIKGYEQTEEIVDIKNYPIENIQDYQVIGGKLCRKDGGLDIRIGSLTEGITPTILVNPYNSYEVSFKFEVTDEIIDTKIIAGCIGLDSLGLPFEKAFIDSPFVKTVLMKCRQGRQYYLKFCIYGLEEEVDLTSVSDFENFGTKFNNESVRYISPYINISSETGLINVWDIKVRLLDKREIFLSKLSEIVLLLKNNSSQLTNSEVEEIIKDYLLPVTFNSNIKYGK